MVNLQSDRFTTIERWAKLEARMAAEAGHEHHPILLVVDDFELVQAMTYTGRPTLASIDHTLVRTDFP